MSHERPDALLKSALEKIVYFEARAAQLTNDLAQAQAERDRVKGELAQASQREIELRRVIAELEVRTQRAHSEREEAATVAEALRRERAELLGKILDASRLNGETSDFDLASFIAELRSEVILRRGPSDRSAPVLIMPPPAAEVVPGPSEPKPSYITAQAQALEAQGRLTVSSAELASLERASPFAGRTEETLFGFSVRELSAPDASARVRAAERLTALGHPAAAPALATALHAETEGRVKVALLEALSHLAKAEAVPVVVPQLSAPAPEVRMTALKALLKLDATQAGPHLAAAVKDPDSAVRRRASLLALSLTGQAALELGETAIRDAHPDVRSLAALVLGASGLESARPWLMTAMRDPEVRVRRSASQALSRLLGQDVSQLVDLDEAQRRREVRRLAQVPSNPVKAKLVAALPGRPGAGSALAPQGHRASPVVTSAGSGAVEAHTGSANVMVGAARGAGAVEAHAAPANVMVGAARGAGAVEAHNAPAMVGAARRAGTVEAHTAPANVMVGAARGAGAVEAHTGSANVMVGAARGAGAVEAHAAPANAIVGAPRGAGAVESFATSSGAELVETVVAGVSARAVQHTAVDDVAVKPAFARSHAPSASGAVVGPAALHAASRVAVLEVPAPTDAALLDGVLIELRAAIRGQSADALAASLHSSLEAVRAACGELMSQGQVVRRGLKYFVA
ncbi:MAG: HEAT repeat domain-containing protein [Myxococcaceae bacterium]|nr:HEAT repeat domain-containing protein [Myxococcaceae bacterium]